jgi:hypothetical protein
MPRRAKAAMEPITMPAIAPPDNDEEDVLLAPVARDVCSEAAADVEDETSDGEFETLDDTVVVLALAGVEVEESGDISVCPGLGDVVAVPLSFVVVAAALLAAVAPGP